MTLQAIIGLLMQGSLMLIVVAIGLQSQWSDVLTAVRRPKLFLRGFIAVNVIVPLTATILCLFMPIALLTKAAIILMGVSPFAPFAPGKMLKAGADTAFVNGLFVSLMLAAVVIVPVTVELLDLFVHRSLDVPVADLAMLVATSILAPLAVGLTIAHFWPGFAGRAAPIVQLISFAIILPIVVLLIAKSFPALIALLGDGTALTICLIVAAGIAGGHLLGGERPEHRAAMAQAAATRHPGIAVLIARRNFDEPQVIMAILLFLLLSIIVCGIYARAQGKAQARALAQAG